MCAHLWFCVMTMVSWQMACIAVIAGTLQSYACVFHLPAARQRSPKRNP